MSAEPAPPWRRQAAGAAWLGGGALFLLTEATAASRYTPRYSYARDFISSLGVPGRFHGYGLVPATSPLHGVMNTGFVAEGLLFLTALALALPWLSGGARRWRFIAAGGAHGLGVVLVGLFHAGGASRTDGTVGLHVLGAVMAIVGGNLALFLSAAPGVMDAPAPLRAFSRAAAAMGLLATAVLVACGALHRPELQGLWERLGVYTITAWELLTGGWFLSRRAQR